MGFNVINCLYQLPATKTLNQEEAKENENVIENNTMASQCDE